MLGHFLWTLLIVYIYNFKIVVFIQIAVREL